MEGHGPDDVGVMSSASELRTFMIETGVSIQDKVNIPVPETFGITHLHVCTYTYCLLLSQLSYLIKE